MIYFVNLKILPPISQFHRNQEKYCQPELLQTSKPMEKTQIVCQRIDQLEDLEIQLLYDWLVKLSSTGHVLAIQIEMRRPVRFKAYLVNTVHSHIK